MHCKLQLAVGAALLTIAFAAPAQKPIVYPAKGQSASQQSKDDGECLAWAKTNTGIDPSKPANRLTEPLVQVRRVAGPAAPEPSAVPVQVAPAAEGLSEMPPSAPLPIPPRELS